MLSRFLISIFCLSGILTALPLDLKAQQSEKVQLARIKYRGGGDWYNDPSALKNLAEFCSQNLPIAINTAYDDVPVGSSDLLEYPFAFLTGHGTVALNQAEAQNLRDYLNNGGFLFIDDDYGLDDNIRKALKKVFPDEDLVELPFDHPIYHQAYDFENGLPKIHEHDGKPPKGFGLFREGRLVLFYSVESNLADGWANPEVHNNPEALRQKALQMGANILVYALTSGR